LSQREHDPCTDAAILAILIPIVDDVNWTGVKTLNSVNFKLRILCGRYESDLL